MEHPGVAVVGLAQTTYEAHKKMTTAEMVYEAVKGALYDAKIEINDINYITTASVDLFDGLTASNLAVTEVVGAVMRPEVRVSSDGLFAAIQAFMIVASGHHDIVLVVAHSKGSLNSHYAVSNWAFDPIYQQTLGLDFLVAAGLQANTYCTQFKLDRNHLAKVVMKNRANGAKNPAISGMDSVTKEEILSSRILAYPISEYDCAATTDGACALVLASRRVIDRFKNPVWIKGLGFCSEAHYLGDRNLTKSSALEEAANKAYNMAGISNPKTELSLAEIADYFSYQELMWMEGLGLSEQGKAWQMIESGLTTLNGKLPVNPSGGSIGGLPYIVGGLAGIAETVTQVRGQALSRQVPGAYRALVHGTSGPCGQSHAVVVLEAAT